MAWRPVVVDVIEGYTNFPAEGFDKHIDTFYPLAVDLLGRELNSEIRLAIQGLFQRIGEARLGLPVRPTPTPVSPRHSVSEHPSRKHSVGRR